nr:PRC-barrel domain-containing protein [Anaerosolibacter carboniphilus]
MKEIIHLPIISVFEGKEIGKIKDIVIEPKDGRLEYFLVDDQSMFNVKVVPMSKIMGIGDEALMIETSDLVVDAQKESKVVELLNKNVSVVNSKIFTKKGKNLGLITEIFIDDESGKILGCEIGKDGDAKFVSSESIITFGKEVTIVEHDVHDKLMASIEEVLNDRKVLETIDEPGAEDTAEAIARKQKEYLLGRELVKTILDGEVLIAYEGQIVTEEVIKTAEEAGKFMELTLSVK